MQYNAPMKALSVLLFIFTSSCSVVQNNDFISRAEILMGEHYYVYSLPFEKGKSYLGRIKNNTIVTDKMLNISKSDAYFEGKGNFAVN